MSILLIIAKIFATLCLVGGFLAGIFYIGSARHKPAQGKTVETISGIIVLGLSLFATYYLWR
jgi:hypothetical protein